jgi:hypothetical protein
MWGSVIAVAGTLLGGLLAGVVQARVARTARRETRAAERRADALGAVTALLAAVADHRRARWVREELRLSGADAAAAAATRDATHVTRAAVTVPLATVCILVPALAVPAEAAVQAAYAMRNAPDLAALEQLRAESVAAERQLRQAASDVFAPERCRGGV